MNRHRTFPSAPTDTLLARESRAESKARQDVRLFHKQSRHALLDGRRGNDTTTTGLALTVLKSLRNRPIPSQFPPTPTFPTKTAVCKFFEMKMQKPAFFEAVYVTASLVCTSALVSLELWNADCYRISPTNGDTFLFSAPMLGWPRGSDLNGSRHSSSEKFI